MNSMLYSLPQYYHKSAFLGSIYNTIDALINKNAENNREKINNMLAVTATDLAVLENDLHIIQSSSAELEVRRATVLSVIRGTGIFTLEKLDNLIKSYTNAEYTVVAHPTEGYVDIMFDNPDFQIGYDELKAELEKYLPAWMEVTVNKFVGTFMFGAEHEYDEDAGFSSGYFGNTGGF